MESEFKAKYLSLFGSPDVLAAREPTPSTFTSNCASQGWGVRGIPPGGYPWGWQRGGQEAELGPCSINSEAAVQEDASPGQRGLKPERQHTMPLADLWGRQTPINNPRQGNLRL